MKHASPVRFTFAALFVGALALYSLVWMTSIRRQDDAPTAGFEYVYEPSRAAARLTRVSDAGPAAAAGLEADHLVLAVNGVRLDRYEKLVDAFAAHRPGDTLALTVAASAGGQPRVVPVRLVRLGDLVAPQLSIPYAGSRFVALVLNAMTAYPLPFLAVLAFVLLQHPDNRHAWAMAITFAGFIAGVPLLEIEFLLPPRLRGFMIAVSVALSFPLSAMLYYLFATFPESSWIDRRVPWLKYLLPGAAVAVSLPLAAACLWANGSAPIWWAVEQWRRPWVEALMFAYAMGSLGLGLASLATNAFGAPQTRRKTQVILAGTVLGLLPFTLINVSVAVSGRPPAEVIPFWAWAVAVLALSLIPISMAYALVKHRVLELPVLFRRSARYLLVRRGVFTLAIVAGLACTLALGALLDDVFPADPRLGRSAGLLLGAVFGSMLALTGHRAWRPAQDRIDRAFFRNAYDARRILEDLAIESRTATDRRVLAARIEFALEEALHPRALHVYLRSEHDPHVLAAAGADADALAGVPLDMRHPCLVRLAEGGDAVTVTPDDLAEGGEFETCRALEPEMLVPIVGRGSQLEGLLVLGPRLSEEPYSGEDRALLASAAAQAGVTLESIRLAESMAARIEAEHRQARDLQIAKDVQAKLLPQQMPAVATLDYAGACVQARQVGGDFYDFVRLGPDRVGFVLADVSGKGISAALMMANLQANLRVQLPQAVEDLPGTLRTVNRYFYESTAANHYATLFVGLYDERTRVLRYANCGHLPPIVRRRDGTFDRLPTTGPVVGLFEPWEAGAAQTTIAPGDLLVIFSDGVTDAIDGDGEEFGEDRLEAFVRASTHERAAGLLGDLLREVRTYDGAAQYDDVTVIVARGI